MKIVSDTVEIPNLSLADSVLGSGTPSDSTFLRGDRTWAAPSGGSLTVADVVLTGVTQSSTYSGVTAGTTTNMTDGDNTTGTGTNSGSGEYIEVSWSGNKVICGVRMQAGVLSGYGNQANYMNGAFRELQYWDGASWLFLAFPDRQSNLFVDSGNRSIITIPVGPVLTSKLRFATNSAAFIGCNGFVPIEIKSA